MGMAPKNTEHFATVIREAMTRRGLTQANVAERGGPSDTTLRKILDQEPIGISTATLKKLDTAFGWDPGSAAKALAGGEPRVSGVIRGRGGRVIQSYQSVEGGDQDELELLRLAALIMDARDMVHSPAGPLTAALAVVMDEAAELITRTVARWGGPDELGAKDIQDAEWRIDEVRAGGSIRRRGNVYVADTDQPPAPPDIDVGWLPADVDPAAGTGGFLAEAARTAEAGYQKGQGDQGTADGEENQDINPEFPA